MILPRILSAVLLAAALLALLLWAPAVWTVVTITAAIMGGAWEWSGFLRTGPAGRFAFLLLVAAGLTWCVSDPERAAAEGYSMDDVKKMFMKIA